MAKLLIADDHPKITDVLAHYAKREGCDVAVAYDGLEALKLFQAKKPDVVLLDVAMPKLDGFAVLRKIRQDSDAIVIMVTARSSDADRIMGLDCGADDYIVKPFSPAEVMARVRANLRRLSPGRHGEAKTSSSLELPGLSLDFEHYAVKVASRDVALTKREFELLWMLAQNKNRVMTRDVLLDRLWGDDYMGDARTVDSHITRLRAKLDLTEADQFRITTLRGLGYRLDSGEEET
jgi:DNA-binding response OmpR family regulator